MFCRQTCEFRQPLKQTVAPKVSYLYVFDQYIPLIFHFSQLSGIFLAQKQHTCLQRLFLTSKNSCKEYFVERKQSSRQQPPTSNFKCSAAKYVVFAPNQNMFFPRVYTLRCNRRWFTKPTRLTAMVRCLMCLNDLL